MGVPALTAISIHAPREGSDLARLLGCGWDTVFQSTLPVRGATTAWRSTGEMISRFQSTLPVRGATHFFVVSFQHFLISIHAPREGSDSLNGGESDGSGYFNPRSP